MTLARLYWIGLYEAVEPPMWGWFLHVDRAPAIIVFSKCFLGGGECCIQRSGAAHHIAAFVANWCLVLLVPFYLWTFLPLVLVYMIYFITFFAFFSDLSFWSFLGIAHVISFLSVCLFRTMPTVSMACR
jgi:hypothetical protein